MLLTTRISPNHQSQQAKPGMALIMDLPKLGPVRRGMRSSVRGGDVTPCPSLSAGLDHGPESKKFFR